MVLPLNDPLLIDPYRTYFAYLPKGYDNTRPLPVVYSFHGYYSSAERKMQQDKFVQKIEKHLVPNGKSGFVVIYGQGMNDCGTPHCYDEPYNQRSWNVFGMSESPGPRGHTCNQNRNRFGSYGCYTSCRMRANTTNASGCEAGGQDYCHASTCANDTLYAETLFNTIEDSLCIDMRRQYVTGMSVGGMMAYWVATHFTERFAAAIPVAGSALLGFWQPPKLPIPIMDIHGHNDDTIPANHSNGFVAKGPHSTGKPMKVPGCPECAFSNDGFFYNGNYNITRDIAVQNQCACTSWQQKCDVKPWHTVRDSTKSAEAIKWSCFQSFGDCAHSPVVRCTWIGNHQLPIRGKALNKKWKNLTAHEKHHFFADIAWDFFEKFHIEPGSEKERLMFERRSQTV